MKKIFEPGQPLHPDPSKIKAGLKALLPKEHILLELKAEKRHQALSEMAELAVSKKTVSDKDTLLFALAEREKMISTAQPGGVAFLHTRRRTPQLVKESALFLGRSKNGIQFEAPDGKPTFLFYLLLLQTDEEHLRALSEITRASRNPEFNQAVLHAETADQIVELLPS